jgi:asparagine synthase (glutamine-hydrolysing)
VCGIAGFTHRQTGSDRRLIRDAIGSLAHRGPDRIGVFETDHVALGVARLSIRDIEEGDQPITSAGGDVTIAFNGEIYNDVELRRELSKLGHRFRTQSDTEVVLEAYRQWGKDCFGRLRGMFAVALWTESERRLVLARDRLGIKPLYIYRRGSDVYFGSEIKAILAHPDVERRLNPTALEFYLCFNYVPSPLSMVAGIEKLRPGHWFEWTDGAVESGAYWRLARRDNREWEFEEAREELDRLMGSAVREHMASDVPLGIWLSGGLDSSTVLHYAAEHSREPLKTFSISFQGRSFDESRYFREMASRYGTEHHELDLNPDLDLQDALEEMVHYADEPLADSGALPVWYLSKLSRSHVTVALSGEGADELFGGYVAYRADALVRRFAVVPPFLRRLALKAFRLWPVSDDKVSFEYKAKRFLEGSLFDPDVAHFFWYGGFSPLERPIIMPGSTHGKSSQLFRAFPPDWQTDALNRYLWFDQAYYLPDDILFKCDRMSMAHSLEVRPPFLDHRIVEFAACLPARFKIRGARQKYILRDLMRDRLPRPILKGRKEGFDIPSNDWLRTVLRPLLLDTLTHDAVAKSPLRADRVEALLARHLDRRENLGVPLWGLLILFLWMRHWRIEWVPPATASAVPSRMAGSTTT